MTIFFLIILEIYIMNWSLEFADHGINHIQSRQFRPNLDLYTNHDVFLRKYICFPFHSRLVKHRKLMREKNSESALNLIKKILKIFNYLK